MELSGTQFEQIHGALLAAFPRREDLSHMMRFRLNESLDAIIKNGDSLANSVFSLVIWAESRGRLGELLQAAAADRPQRSDLATLAAEFGRSSVRKSSLDNRPSRSLPSAADTEAAPVPLPMPDPKQMQRLVTAFTQLSTMQDGQRRDTVVSQLPIEIRNAIPRSRLPLDDMLSIVTTCIQYVDGLPALLDAVRFLEGKTYARIALEEILQEIYPGYSL